MNFDSLFQGYLILIGFYIAGIIVAIIWAPWYVSLIMAAPIGLVVIALVMTSLEDRKILREIRKREKESKV